jgi:phosphopantothenoylcysteine synthetase/decarboxylase
VTILTPNALRVVSPRELALIPGHQVVESYFDSAILPRPPPGVVAIVPCSFNSLNKLAAGIADDLALSIAAEAIGRQTPVVVAVSVNPPLWAHPLTQRSTSLLRDWGCTVLDPEPIGDGLTLASDDAIFDVVRQALASERIQGI